ncbi:transposase [Pseudosulfitobacter sp. DSM 107133]|uniref:REP-associated tyrosine transposase n=1 Tax=Pseudosulfitobacter sp. DSM 107133 TaxID=2883100 RepID=UPI000DF1EE30|nr:transposase [Pseudosulfitobacter sp. DSM 107133]UOA27682.1 REP-associated tyrosine transposase [Pseudosulfitobacter sp. DSM 107133]
MIDPARPLPATGTCFFTVRLQDCRSDLLVRRIGRLRQATRIALNAHPFRIDDIVVLPNAIHTIWTMPPADTDVSRRWGLLKAYFSRGVAPPAHRHPAAIRSNDKGIWQRRFWSHPLSNTEDIATHRNLIYSAPVQAGLVDDPRQWPHTSLHRALKAGTWTLPRQVSAA